MACSSTSEFLRDAGELLRASLPVDGTRAVELLGAGVDPGGSALIVLRPPPAVRRSAASVGQVPMSPGADLTPCRPHPVPMSPRADITPCRFHPVQVRRDDRRP